MQKIEAVGYSNLLFVSNLDPDDLVNQIIASVTQAFLAKFHLTVEDPEETEAFLG
jgi:hypothetical protein